jgi:hypothetical protein
MLLGKVGGIIGNLSWLFPEKVTIKVFALRDLPQQASL